MSQKQSIIQRIFSAIVSAIISTIKKQIRDYQRRATQILTILFIGLTLFFIGLGYLTYSLAKSLETIFGLFALGLVGFIFLLMGIIVMMLSRRSNN